MTYRASVLRSLAGLGQTARGPVSEGTAASFRARRMLLTAESGPGYTAWAMSCREQLQHKPPQGWPWRPNITASCVKLEVRRGTFPSSSARVISTPWGIPDKTVRNAMRIAFAGTTLLALTICFGPLPRAHAADIKVLSTGNMSSILAELGKEFERASGDKLAIEDGSTTRVKRRVEPHASADLSTTERSVITALV